MAGTVFVAKEYRKWYRFGGGAKRSRSKKMDKQHATLKLKELVHGLLGKCSESKA